MRKLASPNPRRRRVELCDPGGDILFSGHEAIGDIGDHFISPGVLRRPKSAMDFSERNNAGNTSEGYRWELWQQFVFSCSYSPGRGTQDSFCRAGFFYLLFSNSRGNFFNFWVQVKFWSLSSNKESSVNTFWINFKVCRKTYFIPYSWESFAVMYCTVVFPLLHISIY